MLQEIESTLLSKDASTPGLANNSDGGEVRQGKVRSEPGASISQIEELRKLARSEFGLVNKEVRRRAWPLLLNAHTIVRDDLRAEGKESSEPIDLGQSVDWRSKYPFYSHMYHGRIHP